MKIVVLEHPRKPSQNHFNDIANTPLWSCLMGGYAAAALIRGGHEVAYVDANQHHWDFLRTEKEIFRLSPELLCINAVYYWEHTPNLFQWLGNLRKNGFDGHINLFGFFPSLAYSSLLKTLPAVDSVVVGECEHTLSALANRIAEKEEWHDIRGVASRSSLSAGRFERRPPEKNPDRFPFPHRLPTNASTVSILASRGCYNHCSFCPIPGFYSRGPLWRSRSVENIMQEVEMLVDQGWRDFYFVDPNFIGPGAAGRRRILELAHRLEPLDVTFGMETRPSDLDEHLLEHLVAAGLRNLLIGIESGSAAVLNRIDKHGSALSARNAIRMCRNAGIEPDIGFLMFVPESDLKDLKENWRFLKENALIDQLERTANLLSHCQIILAGTSGYQHFQAQGRLTPGGVLGFEGKVPYRDPRVDWMRRLVVPACLDVLRESAKPDSTVYWQKPKNHVFSGRVNDYLVELFENLLLKAQNNRDLPPVESIAFEHREALAVLLAG